MAELQNHDSVIYTDTNQQTERPMTVDVDIDAEKAAPFISNFVNACLQTGLNPEIINSGVIPEVIKEISNAYNTIDDASLPKHEVRKTRKYFRDSEGNEYNVPDPVKSHLITRNHFAIKPVAGYKERQDLEKIFDTLLISGIFTKLHVCEQDLERQIPNEGVLLRSTVKLLTMSKFWYSKKSARAK